MASEGVTSDLNVPPEVAEAVDLLVAERGEEAAEKLLRSRFEDRDERSIPALSYLRYRYGGENS